MIRRFFTRLLILILIAVCGFNWLQTQRLQAQVAALQSDQNLFKHADQRVTPPPMTAEAQTLGARFRFPAIHAYHLPAYHSHAYHLQARWNRLRNQAGALRSASKKVFHEII